MTKYVERASNSCNGPDPLLVDIVLSRLSLFPEGGRHRTMCPSSCFSPKGVDTRRCASKDAGPQRGVDLGAIPYRLEEGKSVSDDVGPKGSGF